MKEKRINIIVSLMAFAVIGLIAVQVYWLVTLVKVEEERFNRIVNNALFSAVTYFEKNEAAKTVLKKSLVSKGNKKTPKEFRFIGTNFNYSINDSSKPASIIRIDDTEEVDFTYHIKKDSSKNGSVSEIRVAALSNNNDVKVKVSAPRFVFERKLDTLITTKKRLVQNVVAEMIDVNINRPIEKRISVKEIDSVLTREFTNKGINSEFQFGVKKVKQDSLTLLKAGTDSILLRNSSYKTVLFPAEIFAGVNELRVYFPNKERQILNSVIGMIALSAVFIFLIVGAFLKTVQMFIRQKKITEVKNDLINNITHEFKTPISTISLACEALNEPALITSDNSISRYSKIIQEENERLQLMVNTLLNTASMEKDELKVEKSELHLEMVLNAVVSKFEENAKKKDAEIEIINQCSIDTIMGDKFHLSNAFSNLIDNALKFNEKKPIIKIVISNEDNYLSVSISDNGIGIAKENLTRIFETFFRVQSGNIQNVRGNGIGLSYVKKIIELHGGLINVESDTSIGTTFKVILLKQ